MPAYWIDVTAEEWVTLALNYPSNNGLKLIRLCRPEFQELRKRMKDGDFDHIFPETEVSND
jgi:hypothetical protein